MRIFVSMYEKAPNQASSKEDLDQLSALEESMASFALGDLDSEHGVILKDWSAQDFANIYVRFRSHLIGHSRKFLGDETQAEEVVQDAFLYLMTALPELDSELGVLRFLKWKTKMLCLDIIRSSQAGLNNNFVPLPDEVAHETQPLDSLERADDAAIIRLALAKLNPRHREALIATMYEEKSHEEVAHQLGIGENAFRQLLFRARASFRQALVGEADIEGKSVAEILSVAARKAASARNSVLVALLFLTAALITPNFESSQRVADPAEPIFVSSSISPDSAPELPAPSIAATEGPSENLLTFPVSSYEEGASPESEVVESEGSQQEATGRDLEGTPERQAREAFIAALDENLVASLASQGMQLEDSVANLTASNESGLRVDFAIDLNSESIVQFFAVELDTDGQIWKGVPGNSLSVVEYVGETLHVSYAATDFLVGDFSGQFSFVSTSESVFSRSGIKLDLTLDKNGEILGSQISFIPKL